MRIRLSKQYNQTIVFDNFSLDLPKGYIHGILGPSGCGKTTLLQAIAGLTIYNGEISDVDRISYVFQEARLFPYFTVKKNLAIITNDDEKIHLLAQRFSVDHLLNRYPKDLSGGELQRIAMLRAFLNPGQIILMDEAFKSLDFDLKFKLMQEVLTVQKELHSTIVLVTHDLDVALYLADYIHILSNKPTKLLQTYANPHQGSIEQDGQLENQIKRLLTSF